MKTQGNNPLKSNLRQLLLLAGIISWSFAKAQLITGVWRGKIDHKNVELKIIKNGDSLTGTSYYYQSPGSYRRYSIKGYFDARDNSVVWWDDHLIEEKNSYKLLVAKSATPYRSTADFNCPGGTKMYLNGKVTLNDDEDQLRGQVDLQKFTDHIFNDEWDFVIDNYTVGANDPGLIDSIGQIAFEKQVPAAPTLMEQVQTKPPPKPITNQLEPKIPVPAITSTPAVKPTPKTVKEPDVAEVPLTNEQRFATRSKKVMQEIPISGDSIELRFYDDGIVDGDSIAIFLNDRLMVEHVRLAETAYTIKLAVATLQESNELVMVAENLGTIPPNTALMVAMVDGKRYEARLESTEQSSAVIRFVRQKP